VFGIPIFLLLMTVNVPYFLQLLPEKLILFSLVSDPALIGGPEIIGVGVSHVKYPSAYFFSEPSDPVIIRGWCLLEAPAAITRGNTVCE